MEPVAATTAVHRLVTTDPLPPVASGSFGVAKFYCVLSETLVQFFNPFRKRRPSIPVLRVLS